MHSIFAFKTHSADLLVATCVLKAKMECMKAAQHRGSNLPVGKFFLLEHDSKRVHDQTPHYANCIQHGNDSKILLPVTIRTHQHE